MQKGDKEVREMLEERIRVKYWMQIQLKENIMKGKKNKKCAKIETAAQDCGKSCAIGGRSHIT